MENERYNRIFGVADIFQKENGKESIKFNLLVVRYGIASMCFYCFCVSAFPSLPYTPPKKMCVLCVDFSQAFTLFRIVHICSSQIDISAHSHTHKIIIIIILSSAETHPLPQSHTLKHTLIIVYMSRVTCVIQQKTKATITFLTTMYQ